MLPNLIYCANSGRSKDQITYIGTIPTRNESHFVEIGLRYHQPSHFIALNRRRRHPISHFDGFRGIAPFSPGRHAIFWYQSIDRGHMSTWERARAAISMYSQRDIPKTSSNTGREENPIAKTKTRQVLEVVVDLGVFWHVQGLLHTKYFF